MVQFARCAMTSQKTVSFGPPRWASALVSVKPSPVPTPINSIPLVFGSLSVPDKFEERLVEFASTLGIDATSPGGRSQVLEYAARAGLCLRSSKRQAGRPKKPTNWLLCSTDPAREAVDQTRILIAHRTGRALEQISDAEAVTESLRETRSDIESAGFIAAKRNLLNRISKSRKADGVPAKRGRRKSHKKS